MSQRKYFIALFAIAIINTPLQATHANTCIENMHTLDETQLIMDNCELQSKHIPAVVEFVNQHPAIDTISMKNNMIDDDGLKQLAVLSHIKSFNLSNNRIHDEGASSLTKLRIEYLNLSNNFIRDVGAAALARIPYLEILRLSHNHITSRGAMAFINSTIDCISLDGNDIDDEGAIALAGNKYASEIDLSDNLIGERGAAALEKSLNRFEVDPGHFSLKISEKFRDDSSTQQRSRA